MTTTTKLRITNPILDNFYKQVPDFDILHFDFHNPSELAQLKTQLENVGIDQADIGEKVSNLQAYQRLLRIEPDADTAKILLDSGMDSALKITTLSQTQFIKEYAAKLGDDGVAKAKKIYLAAANVKSQTMHLHANVASLVGSRYFRSMSVNHVSASIPSYFESLSSYQEIFGSLNYCECSECKSIFGPAAYLVDLLRIIDKAITVPNASRANTEDNIPDGLKLFDRRPDLAKIQLTCANTNDLIPYLQIVNQVLEKTVGKALNTDNTWRTLAAETFYPFNLPFNLPLQQIRNYLGSQNIALSDIYQAPDSQNFPSREYLHLSIEQLQNLEPTKDASQLSSIVSKNYGLTITQTDLAGLDRLDRFMTQTGLSRQEVNSLFYQNLSVQEIFDTSGEYTLTFKGTKLSLKQIGVHITGDYDYNQGELQGTVKRDESTNQWIISGHWLEGKLSPPDNAGRFEFTFSLDGLDLFLNNLLFKFKMLYYKR